MRPIVMALALGLFVTPAVAGEKSPTFWGEVTLGKAFALSRCATMDGNSADGKPCWTYSLQDAADHPNSLHIWSKNDPSFEREGYVDRDRKNIVTEIIIYTQGPQDEILLALTQKFREPYHTESWSAFNLDNSPFTASLTEWRVGRFNLELAVIGTDSGKITANNDVLTFDGQ